MTIIGPETRLEITALQAQHIKCDPRASQTQIIYGCDSPINPLFSKST